MATTQVSLNEYLTTDYEPDCDYVDGELEERNVGEKEHSIVQAFFIKWLAAFEEQWKLEACPGIRMRVSPTRVRIADVAILPIKGSLPTSCSSQALRSRFLSTHCGRNSTSCIPRCSWRFIRQSSESECTGPFTPTITAFLGRNVKLS
jgi:hypothetical protein